MNYCLETLRCLLLLFVAMLVNYFAGPAIVNGQTSDRNSIEFLESSSPLPGGGKVVSRTTPGSSSLTTTVDAARNQQQQTPPTAQSRLRPQATPSTVPTAPTPNAYPYPASNIPATPFRTEATGAANLEAAGAANPGAASAVATYPPFRAHSGGAATAGFFSPTLGISPRNNAAKVAQPYRSSTTVPRTTARVAQNCGCVPACGCRKAPQTDLQVRGFSVPSSYARDAAATAPSLTIQEPQAIDRFNPGTLPQGGLNLQTPNIGVAQLNNQNQGWTPFSNAANAYQPLVKLANMRPGTFLGQGIIGQPTAYVDGQPLRNLLRYISP